MKATSDVKETVSYVEALQNAVQKSKGDLAARLEKANTTLLGSARSKPQVKLTTYSDGGSAKGEPSLRVTCPSRSVISADIPNSLGAESVEFYLTRVRSDGAAETRLLGTSKYKDSDGKWSLPFTTERFARRRDDPIVVHAEVFGRAGQLLAARGIMVVE